MKPRHSTQKYRVTHTFDGMKTHGHNEVGPTDHNGYGWHDTTYWFLGGVCILSQPSEKS